MILTIPVFYPIIVNTLGLDPIWFGVVQVRMLDLTGITPPLGMIAYIIAGANKNLTAGTVFRGAMPFLLMGMPLPFRFSYSSSLSRCGCPTC